MAQKLFSGWSSSSPQFKLLIVSVLALFCELLIIRWLSTEIRIFAYFKNLPLMSAFLGLGLGFIWTEKERDYLRLSAIALLYLSGMLICAMGLGLTYLSFLNPQVFMLFGVGDAAETVKTTTSWFDTGRNLLIVLSVFVLTTSIFVGLGQRMGRLFKEMPPLQAYSINVFGSLCGTLLFSALSFFSTSPGVWLVIAGMLFLLVDKKKLVPITLIVLGALYSCGLDQLIAKKLYGDKYVKTVWSPYYRIDVVRVNQEQGPFKGAPLGYNIFINYDSFQSILDCSPKSLERFPPAVRQAFENTFGAPYQLLKEPGDVLILGSGTGSDVAAALRAHERHIDAVEIDPGIIRIGKEMHPEHPYDPPNVTVYNTDARKYLKNCTKKYDLINFAALDSHAAFSSMSSLRMDNYVFTQESLQEAAHCLSDKGIIFIKFVYPPEWLFDRHSKALAGCHIGTPFGYKQKLDDSCGILFAGPGVDPARIPTTIFHPSELQKIDLNSPIAVATDDWPFLFLPKKQLSLLYAMPIIMVLLVGFLPVMTQFRQGMKKSINWQMFLLGMGFMLLEVRAMAEMSLLCGSTWTVNSLIISGVLLIVLFANWVAAKLSPKHLVMIFSLLLADLLISTLVRAGYFSRFTPPLDVVFGSSLYLSPVIFSSILFAVLFKYGKAPDSALAFNLMGGLIGVCLEYLSMVWGVQSLGWLAISLYALVFLVNRLGKPLNTSDEPGTS